MEMLMRRDTGLVPRNTGWDIDRLFRDVFEDMPMWNPAQWSSNRFPSLNAWETGDAYHVEAELPGFEEKDIEVTVLGNELRLSGKREEKLEDESKVYHRERFYGEFNRTLRFAVDLDDHKVNANFKNGVLTITLPKAQAALPRKIEVKG
jgi:HSP20 family protein